MSLREVQTIGYERVIMGLYAHNIIVALPLTILFIKLFVRFVTREPAKDIFRSVLLLPLDFVYIAFGLLLTAMARRVPGFVAHYGNDKEADYAGVILCCGLFVAACLVTWMHRGVRLLWQKFYAAWTLMTQMQDKEQQLSLPTGPGQPLIRKVTVVFVWIFVYWTLMIPLIFFQVLIAVEALGSILKRLQ